MAYTDQELERLSASLASVDMGEESTPNLHSLMTRLKAERDAGDLLQLHYESGVFDDLDEGDIALIVQALEARRKAAGK